MRILKKNLKLKTQVGLFIATVAVTLGVYFLTNPAGSSERHPANFSEGTSGPDHVKDLKKKIIGTLKISNISKDEAEVTVSLPAEICESYQKFSLALEAEGAAMNGEPLQIKKLKTCTDLDPETLELKWLVGRPDQPALLDIRIQTWNIKSLNFYEGAEVEALSISSYEIIYVLGAPVAIHLN